MHASFLSHVLFDFNYLIKHVAIRTIFVQSYRPLRSLLGLPGGRNHPMFEKVEAAATDRGMTLVDGRGNDPDTLGKRLVYVMDSRKFPFYQAEVCE